VYYYRTRFYNKTLTFTSFFAANHWNLRHSALSTSKISIVVFDLETNTGDVGGFLQVQHNWGVNSYELLNPGTYMKIMDRFIEVITCLPQNRHLLWWAKMNGTQRRVLLSPWRIYYMHYGVPKGTSRDKATSNSKKIKPIALAVIKLRLSEGIK